MTETSDRRSRAGSILARLDEKRDLTAPKFDREAAEHRYRGLVLAGVFALIVFDLLTLVAAWLRYGQPIGVVKDMAAIILAPTFTLFGTIVGFYFSRGR